MGEGELGVEAGAEAGLRDELEGAAGEVDALGDAGEAEGIAFREGGLGVAAAAAVGDFGMEAGRVGDDGDNGGGRAGVAGDVGEGFLDEAEDHGLQVGREARGGQAQLKLERDAGLGGKAAGVPFEGGPEAEVVEDAGAELQGELADGAQEFVGEADRLAEGRGGGAGGFELETQTGEELADLVVEFVGEEPAFVFAGAEEAGGEAAGAFLGGAALAVLVLEVAGALGDLIGEGAVEGGEFLGEPGVEALGVGMLQGLLKGKYEFREGIRAAHEVVVGAEGEGGDGGLAGGGGREDHNRHGTAAGAKVAQGVEHGGRGEAGAEDEGVEVGRVEQGGIEFGGRRGGEVEGGSVGAEEGGDGGLLGGGGLDEEDAVGAGGAGDGGGLTAGAGVDAMGDLGDAAEVGRVFIDAIDGPGAKGADGERRLAVAADHDDGRGIAAGGEFAEDLKAVEVGHHQIDEEHVELGAGHGIEAGAAGGDVGELGVAVLGEVEPDDAGDLLVVLGVKHAERPARSGGDRGRGRLGKCGRGHG